MSKYTNEERKLLCNGMYVVNQTFNVDSVYIKEELSTYFNKKVYYMNICMFYYKECSKVKYTYPKSHLYIHREYFGCNGMEVFSKGFHSSNMRNVG